MTPSPHPAAAQSCAQCGHTHSHTHSKVAVPSPRRLRSGTAAAARPAAAPRRPDPSGISDRQLEVVLQQLRAHSIDVDAQHRVAYRLRSDGKYEKITLREAVLIATGRRKVAS